MDTNEKLARLAYETYGKVTNFKNYQGKDMPAFDDLPEAIRRAWRVTSGRLFDEGVMACQTTVQRLERAAADRARADQVAKSVTEGARQYGLPDGFHLEFDATPLLDQRPETDQTTLKDWTPVLILGMGALVIMSNMVIKRWVVTLSIWAVVALVVLLALAGSSPR